MVIKSKLTTIVLHGTLSSNLNATANFLTDTILGKSSAHILIDRDGQVTQLVPFNFISYHAREYNSSSIGIELMNNGQEKYWDRDNLSRLIKSDKYHIIKTYNSLPNVSNMTTFT